jgi:hypothetical protein
MLILAIQATPLCAEESEGVSSIKLRLEITSGSGDKAD